jgi:asparagine synthase (glutamine-hydrolysing)
MCGIAGAFERNGRPVSLEMVENMGNLAFHRGPDNFSFSGFNKHLGLAHNRLSLLDLSPAANQPFKNENYALVYNGEIYNFREIRKRLEKDYNVRFETSSDTEVLFYSLIHDGIESCLKQLRGMFAFAFYDGIKSELWLSRDHLGIKPLYYFQNDTSFYWSSEIKALAQTFNLKPDPLKTLFSINGIAETSNEYTLFNEILPVKPGSFLKITADNQKPQEYFYYKILDDFDPQRYRELEKKSRAEVLAEFEDLLTKSVNSMLVSDAPLGSFVSGGIDSSLISAIADKTYPNLKLFTANVLGEFSEYEDAKALSDYLGKELLDYKFKPEQMLSDWAEVTYFYECPIVIHTNAIPFSNVARLARDSNVKAVLTGEGADELFLGYPRLLTDRYKWLATLPITAIKSFYKLIPGLEDYLFPNRKQTAVEFAGQLIRQFESPSREAEMQDKFAFLSESQRQLQQMTIKMLGDHLVGLLHRNDRMGMMASIEARFPFLDEELVKFAINLPAKHKIGRSLRWHNYKHPFSIDKWVVRKTAEKYLPKRLANKKKNGFPMSGHKFVKVKNGFFKNGWVAENLALNNKKQEFMLETQNPYFIAKLASTEIFGRIYGLGESVENVKNHILRYTEMLSASLIGAGLINLAEVSPQLF